MSHPGDSPRPVPRGTSYSPPYLDDEVSLASSLGMEATLVLFTSVGHRKTFSTYGTLSISGRLDDMIAVIVANETAGRCTVNSDHSVIAVAVGIGMLARKPVTAIVLSVCDVSVSLWLGSTVVCTALR